MLDSLTTTQVLAALIGLYFASAGTGLLADRNAVSAMMKELSAQPMLGYLAGVIAFAIGGAIVAVHNDWSGFLSGFVSLIGWISLAEGVLMLAIRKRFLGWFDQVAQSNGFITGMGWMTLVAGIALLIASLSG